MKPMPKHDDPRCGPVRRLLQTVGSKWSGLVVSHLKSGPKRFSELRRSIGGITQKSLTSTLRELERDGLVERVVTPSIPPRVDYSLTPLGRSLTVPLDALTSWAVENECAVAEAQLRFDARQDGTESDVQAPAAGGELRAAPTIRDDAGT